MTKVNRSVLQVTVRAIDAFINDEMSIADMQAQLQNSFSFLERGSDVLAEEIRLAEADLEEIQFTMLLDEQRPNVIFRLERLRDVILSELRA